MQHSFYTYVHRRADDGAVFYVGKGRGRRARQKTGRSGWWKNVAERHGLAVEILAHWQTENEAFEHERLLISCFRDLGAPLVNLTAGGEGAAGAVRSEHHRRRISEANKGRRLTPEQRERLIASRRSSAAVRQHVLNMAAARRGVPLTPEHKAKLSALRKGKPLGTRKMYAAPSGQSKSAADWSLELGIKPDSVRKMAAARRGVFFEVPR